jgi:hypothetical protein
VVCKKGETYVSFFLGEIQCRDLFTQLPSIYEYHENWVRDGRTFVTVVNKIAFPRVP